MYTLAFDKSGPNVNTCLFSESGPGVTLEIGELVGFGLDGIERAGQHLRYKDKFYAVIIEQTPPPIRCTAFTSL